MVKTLWLFIKIAIAYPSLLNFHCRQRHVLKNEKHSSRIYIPPKVGHGKPCIYQSDEWPSAYCFLCLAPFTSASTFRCCRNDGDQCVICTYACCMLFSWELATTFIFHRRIHTSGYYLCLHGVVVKCIGVGLRIWFNALISRRIGNRQERWIIG